MNQKYVEDTQYEKWAKYYFFFYFNEEMLFGDFIDRVKAGWIPRRGIVDWNKVKGVYQQELV